MATWKISIILERREEDGIVLRISLEEILLLLDSSYVYDAMASFRAY